MARKRPLPNRQRRFSSSYPVKKPVWNRLAYGLLALAGCAGIWAAFLVLVSGCSVTIQPEKPPLAVLPSERPAMTDEYGSFSKPGQKWVQDLAQAYLRNCVTLRVLRGEDPLMCQDGLR